MPKRRQRPGSKTIAKKLNRKLPTPLPDTSPTPSVLLRRDRGLRGSTPLYDKEVDCINKNPAQHPPSPSVTPSTIPSSLSSSTYTQSSRSSSRSLIPRPPPSRHSETSNRSLFGNRKKGLSSRQRRLDQKRDAYFANKALEIQEKEIRKLERELRRQERHRKIQDKAARKAEKLKEDALLATSRYYNKEDKVAIDMIDWVRNYCENKSKGTLDTFSELFEGFDTSRDGYLSRDEFKIRMRDLGGFERVPTPHFDRAFNMIDVNKDGEVSFNEMRYAVVRDEMGKKITAYKRASYNDGRFRNRNDKLSHIRKIRGSTSTSTNNKKLLKDIVPLSIEQQWLKNRKGLPELKPYKEIQGAVLDASRRRFSKDSSVRTASSTPGTSEPPIKKPPSRRYNLLTQAPVS